MERSNNEKENIIHDLNGQINNFDLENQELNKIISELEEKKNILEIELNEIRFVEKNKNGENQFNGGMEVQLQDLIQKNNAYIKEINILNDENKKLKIKIEESNNKEINEDCENDNFKINEALKAKINKLNSQINDIENEKQNILEELEEIKICIKVFNLKANNEKEEEALIQLNKIMNN